MTGFNLPPGVSEHMIPGNRPEDISWNNYWESDRPREVYVEVHGYEPPDEDLEDLYNDSRESQFKRAIDRDFNERYFGGENNG